MNEQRLRELMSDSVDGVEASDSLRVRMSAAVGGARRRRRTTMRGWIAVGGAGLAAAAVLLAVPLIRAPESAAPGPGNGVVTASTGVTPVDDVEDVLGGDTWYGVAIVAQGKSLALSAPPQHAEDSMRIKLDGNGLSGYDGCHWFNAARALLESAPSNTVALTVTANSCGPDPVGSKEFYDALKSGPKSWVLDRGLLVLTSGSIEISFSKDRTARPPSNSTARPSQQDVVALLRTKTWYVTQILASRAPVKLYLPTDPGRALRIGMKRGSLEGFDGCNWLGASPALLSQGANATVGMSATDVGCTPRPDGQDQFLEALRAADKVWSERDGELVLQAGVYEITFTSTPATSTVLSSQADVVNLFGSQPWYVTGVLSGGEPVQVYRPADPEMGLWLRVRTTTVTVNNSCNFLDAPSRALMSRTTGQYQWGTTDVLCPARPGQAQLVSAVTANTKSWFVSGEVIVLQAAGYDITFSSKAPAPSAPTTTG